MIVTVCSQINTNGTGCQGTCAGCKSRQCREGQRKPKKAAISPDRSPEEKVFWTQLLHDYSQSCRNTDMSEAPRGLFHTSMSSNQKLINPETSHEFTQQVWATTFGRSTCPESCPLWTQGLCYGRKGPLWKHWELVSCGLRGLTWDEFVAAIAVIPAESILRGQQVGDLPTVNGLVHTACLDYAQAAGSNNKKAWTYSHHALNGHNVNMFKRMIELGLTVNVSLNSLSEVGEYRHGLPQCVVIPKDYTGPSRFVVNGCIVKICPAQLTDGRIACSTCCGGRPLCSRSDRREIVAFIEH